MFREIYNELYKFFCLGPVEKINSNTPPVYPIRGYAEFMTLINTLYDLGDVSPDNFENAVCINHTKFSSQAPNTVYLAYKGLTSIIKRQSIADNIVYDGNLIRIKIIDSDYINDRLSDIILECVKEECDYAFRGNICPNSASELARLSAMVIYIELMRSIYVDGDSFRRIILSNLLKEVNYGNEMNELILGAYIELLKVSSIDYLLDRSMILVYSKRIMNSIKEEEEKQKNEDAKEAASV